MDDAKRLTLTDTLAGAAGPWLSAFRKGGAERLIGEKLLNYVGMLLIVLGGAFFLKYTHGLAGPAGKLAIGLVSGLALVSLGEYLFHRPDRAAFSLPVIGGGWILVYYTVFAARYLPASRLIDSTGLELLLLCVTAAGMIGHSLNTRSRLLTVFAFGTAYFVFALTHQGLQTLTVCAVLALAGACLVRPLDSPEVAAVNLAGFYLNYLPLLGGALFAASGQAFPVADFWRGAAAAAVVHSAYAMLTPMRKGDKPDNCVDAALSFSAVLYAVAVFSQVRAFAPAQAAAGLLALAAVLTGLSALRGGREDSALTQVQALLGAAALAAGIFALPGLTQRAWGLALAPTVLGTLGLWLDRKGFERYGLAMLGLALCGALVRLPLGPGLREPVALSLVYLGVSAYAFAVLRSRAEAEDRRITGLWAYGGLAAVALGGWTCLSPAAFAAALFALGMLLEWAADEFELDLLLDQAILVETAAGLYCFLIDYGANRPVLPLLTPSRLVTGAAVLCFVTAIFGREMPQGKLLGLEYAAWRGAQSWLMCAAAASGFSVESRPQLRLPFLGASALVLLGAGRSRLPQAKPVAASFRMQAYIGLLAASAAGVWSYLLFPGASALEGRAAAFVFWVTAVSWLVPLAWQPWAADARESREEAAAQHLFGLMSLILPALYIAKTCGGAYMTLSWTLLASAYLVTGLVFRRRALRLPGLGLAGLCVAKALFVDLTSLQLPYRVLSYTVLGVMLVSCSYLYVRLTGKEDCDEI
ncbi:MAG: DUF2339 domain-containing protein [Elusimicrobia bacterium]|nr:DUF2339 domain-containing protein [Elusimicrobiota bacterium]